MLFSLCCTHQYQRKPTWCFPVSFLPPSYTLLSLTFCQFLNVLGTKIMISLSSAAQYMSLERHPIFLSCSRSLSLFSLLLVWSLLLQNVSLFCCLESVQWKQNASCIFAERAALVSTVALEHTGKLLMLQPLWLWEYCSVSCFLSGTHSCWLDVCGFFWIQIYLPQPPPPFSPIPDLSLKCTHRWYKSFLNVLSTMQFLRNSSSLVLQMFFFFGILKWPWCVLQHSISGGFIKLISQKCLTLHYKRICKPPWDDECLF